MYALLDRALKMVMVKGTLHVTGPDGSVYVYGDGTGTPVNLSVKTPLAAAKVATDADLHLGECFMEGSVDVTDGTTIYDALAILMDNGQAHRLPKVAKAAYAVRKAWKRVDQYNPVGKAKNNVAHHYDLSGALYDLFLDRDRQYSCAYFETDDGSLEDAQLAKKRHLAAKLDIKPGMKVLDIGSGWGGLGLYIAEICGADVTGVTLSEEQFKLSNERAKQRGVADRVQFLLKDYRHLNQKFDRIVSVGMFEHVGVGHFKEFFAKVNGLLKDDGVAVLHSINRSDGPGATSAWIKKYIFPGGYIPALSEVLPHIERAGLYVTDIEILRLHYARTLRDWAQRFNAHRERARELYDERFCRMWEFYLAASECAFRFAGMNNFQIQFVKNQHALPFTRNYMIEEEDRLRDIDSRLPRFKSVPAE
ncbi:class I SAM-dependent methyltransferase [Aestuariivirga sp.]|jgi:cyclopropane-fatty-acyl-phospholipid synthase|uniref:class I SAM-dependent methyltransferase n=1 Tax=Aestuariivirga sp. TaxID=2650926 RepID=UPI003783C88C